jgi:carbonic anhydrase
MKNLKYLLALTLVTGTVHTYAASGHGAHWSYEGKEGPIHWGDISEEFKTCKLGKSQSPLDIETKLVKKSSLGAIKTNYKASAAELVNNGHTIQVNLKDGGSADLGGKEYKILQFHFHTPSEEKVDGKAYPINAHLVHKSADGKLGVIGVFFKEGKENTALKDIFSNLPKTESKASLSKNFNAADLLPQSTAYYSYTGSLTTPPCSEDVSFFILKNPIELSSNQLASFKQVFKMNARPVQPLNGRVIQSKE